MKDGEGRFCTIREQSNRKNKWLWEERELDADYES